MLSAVGETSYGIRWGSSEPHIFFTICLCIYLYLRCKIYPYPVKQTKSIFSQQKRKQPSLPSVNNAFVFVDRTIHHLPRRLRLKCDDTRAKIRFRLSAQRTSPFKSAGASVQSTTVSRVLRIRGSNAGYTMFWGSVKSTGYPLHSPVSPPVRHRVPSYFNWTLPLAYSAVSVSHPIPLSAASCFLV